MQRIVIVGPAGSGKSTLARRLGEILDLPVVHLDAHYWRPGWQAPMPEKWREQVYALVGGESWILDGNYSVTLDLRFDAADAIVFLDVPRRTCLRRVLTRSIRFYGQTRLDSAPGCPERLDWTFLKWVWSYPAQRRPDMLQRLAAIDGRKRVIRLRTSNEIREFLHVLATEES